MPLRESALATPASIPQGQVPTSPCPPCWGSCTNHGLETFCAWHRVDAHPACRGGWGEGLASEVKCLCFKNKKCLRGKAVGREGTKLSCVRLPDLRGRGASQHSAGGPGLPEGGSGRGAAAARQEHVGGAGRTGLQLRATTPDACKRLLSSSPVSICRMSLPGALSQVAVRAEPWEPGGTWMGSSGVNYSCGHLRVSVPRLRRGTSG